MQWNICVELAAAVLLLSCGFSVFRWIRKNIGISATGRNEHPFVILTAGVFVSSFLLFLPLDSYAYVQAERRSIWYIASALHHALQLFPINTDQNLIKLCYELPEMWPGREIYAGFLSAEYILAPVLTFGFIMSLFRDLLSYCRNKLSFFREKYVFSPLNDRTITLAEDIRKNHRFAAIVFADVPDSNDDPSARLIGRARRIHAICFRKDLSQISFSLDCNSKMKFFLFDDDESENISQALDITERYPKKKGDIYILAGRIDSELLFSRELNAAKGGAASMNVHLVDPIHALICNTLYEDGDRILLKKPFENQQEGQRKLHAVIVGIGQYGSEMIRALFWYGQIRGVQLFIDAFDEDPCVDERFLLSFPELKKADSDHAANPPEYTFPVDGTSCVLRIHSGISAPSMEFFDRIRKADDVTYVLVSLGNDAANIRIAADIVRYFKRENRDPVVQAVVCQRLMNKKAAGPESGKTDQNSYNIEMIGDVGSSFLESVIIASQLEKDALEIHREYGASERDFYANAYNYRSSCAGAIHAKAAAYFLRKEYLTQEFPGKEDARSEYTIRKNALEDITNIFMETNRCSKSANGRDTENQIRDMETRVCDFIKLLAEKDKQPSYAPGEEEAKILQEITDNYMILKNGHSEIKGCFSAQNWQGEEKKALLLEGALWVVRLMKQEHLRWNMYMRSEGYIRGVEKDTAAKTHPLIVSYEKLPPDELAKDIHLRLILSNVDTLAKAEKESGQVNDPSPR